MRELPRGGVRTGAAPFRSFCHSTVRRSPRPLSGAVLRFFQGANACRQTSACWPGHPEDCRGGARRPSPTAALRCGAWHWRSTPTAVAGFESAQAPAPTPACSCLQHRSGAFAPPATANGGDSPPRPPASGATAALKARSAPTVPGDRRGHRPPGLRLDVLPERHEEVSTAEAQAGRRQPDSPPAALAAASTAGGDTVVDLSTPCAALRIRHRLYEGYACSSKSYEPGGHARPDRPGCRPGLSPRMDHVEACRVVMPARRRSAPERSRDAPRARPLGEKTDSTRLPSGLFARSDAGADQQSAPDHGVHARAESTPSWCCHAAARRVRRRRPRALDLSVRGGVV